jgi:hypothetical protein
MKREIYECLNAEEYYSGVSGTGEGRLFTRKELIYARGNAKSKDVIDFINSCISELTDEEDTVYISFS